MSINFEKLQQRIQEISIVWTTINKNSLLPTAGSILQLDRRVASKLEEESSISWNLFRNPEGPSFVYPFHMKK